MNEFNQPDRDDALCDRLDDYVDGVLSAEDGAKFEAHASECAMCRAAVDQQQWLDDVLQSAEATALEEVPESGRRQLATQIASLQHRQKTRGAATGVAAAAALLAAFGWWSIDRNGGNKTKDIPRFADVETSGESPDIDAADATIVDSLDGEARANRSPLLADSVSDGPSGAVHVDVDESPTVADFQGDGDVIAVRLESPSPDVTVFEVFPTTDSQRRRELAALLADAPSLSNGDF